MELTYRTSTRCSDGCGGCCVEFAQTPDGGVALRDTSGKVVTYTAQEWRDFEAGVKAGEFTI